MACQKCSSDKIFSVTAKCTDLCFVVSDTGKEHDGYVPENIGIGGGDYVRIKYCIDCGQIQGTFPINFKGKFK